MVVNSTYLRKTTSLAVVVPFPFMPPTNGGQRVCLDLCSTLGHQFNVTCFSTPQSERPTNFSLEVFFSESKFRYLKFHLFFKLFLRLRNINAKVCIVNQPFFTIPSFIACRLAKCSLVTYSHNLEWRRTDGLRQYFGFLFFIIEFFSYQLSDCIFFISKIERAEAIRLFKLNEKKCIFVPHIATRPKLTAGAPVSKQQSASFSIIFFGDFGYPPNNAGLSSLLKDIFPLLGKCLTGFVTLTIFGKHIPQKVVSAEHFPHLTLKVLGFVDNPSTIIGSADIMVCPVIEGAGVQTKIIETIAEGTTVISARSGARGIDVSACGEKLHLVKDRNWQEYADKILQLQTTREYKTPTPESFFDVYSESAVTNTILESLKLS